MLTFHCFQAALTHLAEQGDVVALLPDVEFVIHLSDTFIDKLETVTAKPSGSEPKKGQYDSGLRSPSHRDPCPHL
jgi:hypothetical protein